MHADIWIKQLGAATEESISRLQTSLNEALPYALGIFEASRHEEELKVSGVFAGEAELMAQWKEKVEEIIAQTSLELPDWSSLSPKTGGRYGEHTEHLQPLLDEMSEVFKTDPTADW